MSGRFRLDPRDGRTEAPFDERAPAPPSPAAAPGAPRPPPRPLPKPAPAAPARPAGNRRLVLIGAAVVALLLVGGAVAVYVATVQGYPDKYVLSSSEMPSGMRNAQLSASERDDLGIRSNPGEMSRDAIEDDVPTSDEPKRGHVQVLETSGGSRIAIVALQYPDEETARSAASEARAICTFANGVVLRDGDVVALVFPEDDATRSAVRAVGNALRESAGMDAVCGL